MLSVHDSTVADRFASSTRFQRGVTVLELMVAVAIVGIALSLALPSFNDSIERNRVVSTVNEMVGAMNLVRAEAIRTNRTATFCASADQSTCGGTWADGWIALADLDGDAVMDVLRTGSVSEKDVVVAAATQIDFNQRGIKVLPAGATTIAVQPLTCVAPKQHRRVVSISPTGGASVANHGTQAECI
jgi:type IV fimbrial biogenesis protein FimT